MIRTRICNAIALLALLPLAGPSPAKAQTKTPVVRERQENQHDRIKEGVKDDDLTRREAARLRAEGIDALMDDRDQGAGGKFAAADLIGVPFALAQIGDPQPFEQQMIDGMAQAHSTSKIPAAPMPPPMHMVTATRLAPRRRPSIKACPVSRWPLTP